MRLTKRDFAAILLGPKAAEALTEGRCPFCGSTSKTFRDDLSRMEHDRYSGLCQSCQDAFFTERKD